MGSSGWSSDVCSSDLFVLDSHRRLVQMFATVVLGMDGEPFEEILRRHRAEHGVINDADLPPAALRATVDAFRAHVDARSAIPYPEDPYDQLRLATEAVFHSWNSRRAFDYRRAARIADDLGTAVNVVAMVFGNTGNTSGTEIGRAHV